MGFPFVRFSLLASRRIVSLRSRLFLESLEDRRLLSYALTDLGTLPGGTISQGYGLNAAGQAAGIADIPTPNVERAFL